MRYQLGMDLTNLEALRASSMFETFPKEMQDFLNRVMSTAEGAMESPTPSVGNALEIHKLPRTPRPKKDPQVVGPVCMSPQNLQFGKLSMEDKGKMVNLETGDEEEDL